MADCHADKCNWYWIKNNANRRCGCRATCDFCSKLNYAECVAADWDMTPIDAASRAANAIQPQGLPE